MNKKIFITIITFLILVILIFFIFFYKNTAKNLEIGNNKSSQEIVDYILNISSYETTIEVEVTSNKNSNKYILKQQYIEPNTSTQEVIEPSNIAGVKMIKENNTLKIENTTLKLTQIFENYNYLADNCLDLITFNQDYKTNETSTYEEIEEQIVMKTQSKNGNKYTKYKTLYVNKQTCKPTKLEIKDDNRKTTVNILYNEVKIN